MQNNQMIPPYYGYPPPFYGYPPPQFAMGAQQQQPPQGFENYQQPLRPQQPQRPQQNHDQNQQWNQNNQNNHQHNNQPHEGPNPNMRNQNNNVGQMPGAAYQAFDFPRYDPYRLGEHLQGQTLNELYRPQPTGQNKSNLIPEDGGPPFDLHRGNMLALAKQESFEGRPEEDPNEHISRFNLLCSAVPM